MNDEREPGQSIAIASVPNLRDLGGWPELVKTLFAEGAIYDRLVGAAGDKK